MTVGTVSHIKIISGKYKIIMIIKYLLDVISCYVLRLLNRKIEIIYT